MKIKDSNINSNKETTTLKIQNLVVGYDKTAMVLNQLNLDLSSNAIHGIVGLNGAGKTTLLYTISGFISPTEGSILYEGQPLEKSAIAFLETHNFFYHKITGKEYLGLFKTQNTNFQFEQWNTLFELPLNKLIETYSTGMKKKLAFLAVLSLDRPIIILDEPFNGLDLESNLSVKKVLQGLKEAGKTIIITSHILEALTEITDYIHYLSEKKILKTFEKTNMKEVVPFITTHSQKENSQLIEELLK